MKNKLSVSYWLNKGKDFSIEVKAFADTDEKWFWCVYAHVFDSHSKFNDNEYLMNVPMHGGNTFDEQRITQPIGGCRYDWMKTRKAKVIGCDFAHIHDDHENHPGPADYDIGFIPEPFYSEAVSIASELERTK